MSIGSEVKLGHRLPKENLNSPDDPYKIIYREIDMKLTDRELLIFYRDPKPSFDGNIDKFIDSIRTPSEVGFEYPPSPLDVNCKEDCYIVFKLATTFNWQFSTRNDAVLTKKDVEGKYFNLQHVMPNGDRIPSGDPVAPGCNIVYFRALYTQVKYADGFNLCVDLVMDPVWNEETRQMEPRRTSIIIDPDIRNPGGV